MQSKADRALADLPAFNFPGGIKPRRNYEVVRKSEPAGDWDNKPTIKSLKGVDTEFFTIRALGDAVGKTAVTIRSWEDKGWLPVSRYRTAAPKTTPLVGKTPKGKRLYTRHQIEVVIEAATAAGVLDPTVRRPNWKVFTNAVVDGWKKTS